MSSPITTWRQRRELLHNLVTRELKSRYKGSVLGFLWSVLTPLFMALIYMFFMRIAGHGVPFPEILVGVFAWQFTAQSVQAGMQAVTSNANLVKKVAFPRISLPLATTSAQGIDYILSLGVQVALLIVLLWGNDAAFSTRLVFLPLVFACHFALNLGLACLFAAANVFYRDVQHLVGVGLSAWFFLSPVMYNLALVEQLSARAAEVFLVNPLAWVVTAYRACWLSGSEFPLNRVTLAGGVLPWLILLLGVLVFRRTQKEFADLL